MLAVGALPETCSTTSDAMDQGMAAAISTAESSSSRASVLLLRYKGPYSWLVSMMESVWLHATHEVARAVTRHAPNFVMRSLSF